MGKWYEGSGPHWEGGKRRSFPSKFKYVNHYWDGGQGLSVFKNRADPADTGEGGRYVVPKQTRNPRWIPKTNKATPLVYTDKGRRKWVRKGQKGTRSGGWHAKNRGAARFVPHYRSEHYE